MKKLSFVIAGIIAFLFSGAQVPSINMQQFATGYNSPVDIKNCGDQRLFIVEQSGYIRVLYKDGTKQTTPFLDIHLSVNSAGNEQGLLSLAFSPDFKQDGYFYVNYINGSGSGNTRISRFSVMPNDSTQADPNSEQILLTFAHPYTNHKGATLMFGKDGYLYDTQGDGGSGSDPQGNGQNKNTYLGKILRIDVSDPNTTYVIPATNPFVGQANVREEIWAYGVRNPWRCSMDRITGDMWIGDVGQDAYEEVDFQSVNSNGGENYGWRCREGFHACPNCNTTGCTGAGYTDPIFEMPQGGTTNCSVTGGYVYRGAQFSKLFGLYLHSDFCSGRIWSTRNLGNNTFDTDSPLVFVNGTQSFLTNNIGTFGEDNLGELYIAGRSNGRIYRLTETTNCNPVAFIAIQDTLTGCTPVKLEALRGDTLSYQWYNTSGIINGATAYQYAATQIGWYKVRVSKTNAICQSMSDSVYVLVYDTTAITTGTGATTLCNNNAPLNLTGYLQPTGGVYSGPAVNGNNFSPTQFAGVAQIAYSYTNQFGCVSQGQVQLLVNDTTALVKSIQDSTLCLYDNPVTLSAFNNYAGVYTGTGVFNDSVFNPAIAGTGITTVNFLYANVNGCNSRGALAITVSDTTALLRNVLDTVFCVNDAPVSLNGFYGLNGTYLGNGVANGDTLFNPEVAGQGVSPIQFVYQNQAGCISAGSINLLVNDVTDIIFNIPLGDICSDEAPFALTGYANPTGGVFSGNTVTGGNYDPAAYVSGGNNTVYYQYTNSSGCVSRDSFGLSVITCTGVKKVGEEMLFAIYPNPGHGVVTLQIEVNTTQTAELTITDVLGKTCYTKTMVLEPAKRLVPVDLSQLAKGIYSVQVKGAVKSFVKTLVLE